MFKDTSKEYAKKLDQKDSLSHYKDKFYIPDDTIYMDGNSLGLLSENAEKTTKRVIEEWKEMAINGWNDAEKPWFQYGEYLGDKLASLIGAKKEEVIVANSTTMNIHTLVATFYNPNGKKKKIIMDELNFPSDIYAVKSLLSTLGKDPVNDLILIESRDNKTINENNIIKAMDKEEVALILLPSVLFRSGQLLDLELLTKEAHKRDILIGFDLAHSVGIIPHKLTENNIDFAMWCNYKYLNSGPGSSAGLYVNSKHFDKDPALAGWFGCENETQFEMNLDFVSASDAGAWQVGSPHILSSAPLEGSLEIYNEVGIKQIREKSLKLTSYLMFLIDKLISESPYNYKIGTPRENYKRGGHVAVEHSEEAYRINEALKSNGVIGDFRPPNIIRLAPSPLYTSFKDVWKVVDHLKNIIDKEKYKEFSKKRSLVT